MKYLLLATVAVIALAFGPACAEQMLPYKSDWRTIEAADGSVYKIDQKSISHMNNGTAELIVYAVEGDDYNPTNVKRLWFDCHGHYQDHTGGIGATLYAAPRSIAGQLSAIACAGASDARLDEPPKDAPRPEPKWTDYCKDFSEEACARIRKVVEAKVTPTYCKPGFAVVPTSLSKDQLRICYVMPPLRTAGVPAPSQPATPQPSPSPSLSQTTPARTFSARQIEAIKMTTIAGVAGDYCLEIVGASSVGKELIDVGIELSDFGSPEYERIRRDAKAILDNEPDASRCGTIWNVLGPGGSYGHELVRRRRPYDPPYVWGKR